MFKVKHVLSEEEAALKEKYERVRQRKAAKAAGAAAQPAEADGGAGGAAEEREAAAPAGRGGAAVPRDELAEEAPLAAAAPAPVQRQVATREEVVKLLAAKRKGAAAEGWRQGLGPPVAPAPAATAPEPAPKRAPRAPGEKRALVKRPSARGEGEGGKRPRVEDGAGKLQKVNQWEAMLAGDTLAMGLGTQRPLAAPDVHTRRVFVTGVPASVDRLELQRVSLRVWGVGGWWGTLVRERQG